MRAASGVAPLIDQRAAVADMGGAVAKSKIRLIFKLQ